MKCGRFSALVIATAFVLMLVGCSGGAQSSQSASSTEAVSSESSKASYPSEVIEYHGITYESPEGLKPDKEVGENDKTTYGLNGRAI